MGGLAVLPEDPRITAMKRLGVQAGPAPELSTTPVMASGGIPQLPAPLAPEAVLTPNARDLTRNAIGRDQQELTRLTTTGSGVDQILHPTDGHQIGGLRRLGGIAAKIGDTALSVLSPTLAAALPGTSLHHLQLERQANARLGSDLGTDKEQAGTELLNAQPALKQAALENSTLKAESQAQHYADMGQHYQDQTEATLRSHGYKHDATGNVIPLAYEELSTQQQAIEDLKHSQTEMADASAALKKAQNDPSSPAFRLAQQRVQVAQQNASTAYGRLGLQREGIGMRREMMDANLYGKGADGQPLVGAPQIVGEDGQTHTVGLRAANTAIKQQKGVGTFNDLVGSVNTTRQAMEGLHSDGGSFADAKMIAAMNDPHSMVGKYVNGQLVKGNLNDKQIEALGAVNQLREQIGILRASTGGTAAEAQAQRMLDTLPTAGDSAAIVRNKLKQIDGVLQRLSPSVTSVRGGLSVGARPSGVNTPKSYSTTATGPGGHKIGSNDNGQTWFDVQTGKAVQ